MIVVKLNSTFKLDATAYITDKILDGFCVTFTRDGSQSFTSVVLLRETDEEDRFQL
jgi:hypothetical protein